MSYIPFPNIAPEIFSVQLFGMTLALRWYALAYIAGLLIGWRLILMMIRRPDLWRSTPPMTPVQLENLLTWIILGVVLGGRLGFVLFYEPARYLANPADILRVWEGGMSFHGGFLGVVIASYLYCRNQNIPMLPTADLLSVAAPVGLFLGRIANFINAELWGRPTTMPWGVAFPGDAAQTCAGVAGICARHPSQLYEAALEGLLLGSVLLFLVLKRGWLKRPGQTAGLFFAGYGAARTFVEFFRQADAQYITPDNPLGHVIRLGEAGLSMGQLLSLPMVVVGVALILWARRASPSPA
ncbi:MAG: prolipoprotein diacylglyceryl transferase [Cereibacter sphaeroides]|uniref:Phosphatidylglycerol--prolipoprotein diacylglyceryl transferase n=1 Tax=Cereibacter sphaeroides TaxID=1063 RepID=A0A2W5SC76_CERSP|nr:MAG: prolipoprotein diacylglyceryl transferase [Cereibacter sphaeroides]